MRYEMRGQMREFESQRRMDDDLLVVEEQMQRGHQRKTVMAVGEPRSTWRLDSLLSLCPSALCRYLADTMLHH